MLMNYDNPDADYDHPMCFDGNEGEWDFDDYGLEENISAPSTEDHELKIRQIEEFFSSVRKGDE